MWPDSGYVLSLKGQTSTKKNQKSRSILEYFLMDKPNIAFIQEN